MKLNTCNQDIFFCSDPHYHHKSLVRGTTEWISKKPCRDFDTLEDHDNALVNNINNLIKEDDMLFCNGDWGFGQYKNSLALAREFRDRINCKNVHLVLGNHDTLIARNKEDIQSIFSSVSYYKELYIIEQLSKKEGVKAIKTPIILSHYAMRTWNKSHRGSIMLHGHSHGTLEAMHPLIANPTWIGDDYYSRSYKTMDVGFDTHPEFRPYSWNEIKAIMQKKDVTIEVDHHTKKR